MTLTIDQQLYIASGIIVPLIIGIITILYRLRKKPYSEKHYDNQKENTIVQRATAINDIKHLQDDVKEIKKNIENLYDELTKHHVDFDKLTGLIHDLELKVQGLKR